MRKYTAEEVAKMRSALEVINKTNSQLAALNEPSVIEINFQLENHMVSGTDPSALSLAAEKRIAYAFGPSALLYSKGR